MSDGFNFFEPLIYWLSVNYPKIIFVVLGGIVIFIIYRVIASRIVVLRQQKKLDENTSFILKRTLQWVFALLFLAFVFQQLGVDVGIVGGFLALAGGTIIGFAAMNTLGNAIAGIIVMVSRPFKIGDRIYFNGQFADVVAVDLIYTRMKTLDNVLISIPNQELLKSEIDNYGKKSIVRRSCTITIGYEVDPEHAENILLEAAGKVDGVLKNPKPYVLITNFKDYAVEYTLYVYTNQIKTLTTFDSTLKKFVLKTCKQHKIDISTPFLLRQIK